MNQNKILPIDVVDFRADTYSPDGKRVVVSLTTKYSAERRTYALPVTCLHNFIADLQKLYAPSSDPAASIAPAEPPAKAEASQPATKDPNRVEIDVPRKWMMRSGLPQHPYVIVVFDPQTDKQAGYALSAKSARGMAAGFVKYADGLEKHEANKQKPG